MRIGVTLPTAGLAPAEFAAWVRRMADAGYTDLWLGESFGADAVALLAAASAVAPQMRIGTAVLPAATRTPGLLAMSIATLAGLAPGRVSIGLGSSSAAVVSAGGGSLPEHPLRYLRDLLRFLRKALAGERVREQFESFTITDFSLAHPPASIPPLLLAGLRPAALRVAAREADGAVLTLVSADDVTRIRDVVGPAGELVAWLTVCPYDRPDEAEQVRLLARRQLVGYLTVPAYAAAAKWHGRGQALARMHAEWSAGRRKEAMAAIPDDIVDDLVIHGPPEYCRERIAEHRRAGVTVPVINLLSVPGREQRDAYAQLLG